MSDRMVAALQVGDLALDRIRSTDFDWIHEMFSGLGHTIGDGPISEARHTKEWLSRRDQRYEQIGLAWYAIRPPEGMPAGACGAFVGNRCGADPEIGYEIRPAQRGKGYAKAAAQAITAAIHAAGHPRVWATIRPANCVSIHIVEALGYDLVKTETDTKGELLYYRHEVTRAVEER